MAKRTLVVWYSRGGTTSKVASYIAGSLGADLDPIEEEGSRVGFGGYFRSALEAVAKGLPAIRTHRDPKEYDLVVVGTPVWAGTMSSPVRSYLYSHRGELHDTAFFAVMGGRGAEDTLREMRLASGSMHAPVCPLTQREVDRDRYQTKCERFLQELEAQLGGLHVVPAPAPKAPVDFRPRPVQT